MKRLIRAAMAFVLLSAPAFAEDYPVVVELYTSQGCSSCPPADEMMAMLSDREDVIALSLHVDYWDYIGWKDEFAEPQNAKRQRSYASEAGRRSVYTPEMIVNGVTDIVGARPMELAMAIDYHKKDARKVELSVTRSGTGLRIEAARTTANVEEMTVQMLHYQPERVAKIARGENAGRTIHYVNVTQGWQTVANWDGRQPFEFDAQLEADLPVVVLVQAANHGPILAAARVR